MAVSQLTRTQGYKTPLGESWWRPSPGPSGQSLLHRGIRYHAARSLGGLCLGKCEHVEVVETYN